MLLSEIVSPELIEKYAVAGPRYTSYPTAVEFSTSFTSEEWEEELSLVEQHAASDRPVPISLYVHIPFCRSLCLFCACSRIIANEYSVIPPYLKALREEIAAYRARVGEHVVVQQIHWGGGTPNFFEPEEMVTLGHYLSESFPCLSTDADISVELDPRTTSAAQLRALRSIGMNRISVGIQDFDPGVQKAINRIQSFEATDALISDARELGFASINFDLIYGLPGQTIASMKSTIERVIRLAPDRIALYGYAHVTWRSKAQKALSTRGLPSPDQRLSFFLQSVAQLVDAGYVYIGMDHFARATDALAQALEKGTLHRNFMGYSIHKDVSLIGFGASSISTLKGAFAQNYRDIERYQSSVAEHALATERGIKRSSEDRLRGELIEQMLCAGRVSFSDFSERWGARFAELWSEAQSQLREFATDGLIELDSESLAVTAKGRFFVRNLAMVFDEYLVKYRTRTEKVFSQAI